MMRLMSKSSLLPSFKKEERLFFSEEKKQKTFNMGRLTRGHGVVVAVVALGGCMVGPDYKRPAAPISANFKELPGWKLATPEDAAQKGNWWEVFNDPVLDALEKRIDVTNQTLKEDEANYRQAQAVVDEARASLFPVISAEPSVTRSHSGTGGGSVVSASGFTTSGGTAGTTRTQYSLEGSASWTIDVWGAIRRQIQGDVASAQASAATLANARLSAQGSLAAYYMELREQDQLQRVLNDTVKADQRSLDITKNQYTAGVAAQSDVITAQTALDAAEASAINAGVLRAQYEHAIAIQIGVPPAALSIPPVNAVPPVPDVPGVLPSQLLERRPDIAAAERSMKDENALIGVAVAAYYPTISLSGLFGYAGNPLNSLIKTGNEVWSLGAAATETVFNGGERSAAVRSARAAYDESVAAYRLTVLTALQNVEDDLAGIRILAQQDVVDRRAVADATRAVQIALNEYLAGTQAYTTVVTAQTTLLADQETEISIQETRLTDTVALIQALGGGWRDSDLPNKDWLQRRNPLLPWGP